MAIGEDGLIGFATGYSNWGNTTNFRLGLFSAASTAGYGRAAQLGVVHGIAS